MASYPNADAAPPELNEDVVEIVIDACGADSSWFKALKVWLDDTNVVGTLRDALTPMLLSLSQSPEGLGKSVEQLETIIDDTVAAMRLTLIQLQIHNASSFNAERAGSINIYTQDAPKARWFAYLSKCLNAKDRFKDGQFSAKLQECRWFLKFFQVSLSSMPPRFRYTGECWRGVPWVFPSPENHCPEEWFFQGRKFYASTMKSFSKDENVAKNFAQQGGKGRGCATVFHMQKGCLAYDISEFSDIPEKEVVFPILEYFEYESGTKNVTVSKAHAKEPKNMNHTGPPDTVEMVHVLAKDPQTSRAKEVQELEDKLASRPHNRHADQVERAKKTSFEELKYFLREGRTSPTTADSLPLQSARLVIELRDAIIASVEDAVKGKPVIFMIGATGSGKSTLSNWLVGHTLERTYREENEGAVETLTQASDDDEDDDDVNVDSDEDDDYAGGDAWLRVHPREDVLNFGVGEDWNHSRTLIPSAFDLGNALVLEGEFKDLSLIDFPGFLDQTCSDHREFRIAIDLAFRELVNMASKVYALALVEIGSVTSAKGDFVTTQVEKLLRHLPLHVDGKLAWRLGITKGDMHFQGGELSSNLKHLKEKAVAACPRLKEAILNINKEIFDRKPLLTPRAFLERHFLESGKVAPIDQQVLSEHLDASDVDQFHTSFRAMPFMLDTLFKEYQKATDSELPQMQEISQLEQRGLSWTQAKSMVLYLTTGALRFASTLKEDLDKMTNTDQGYLSLQRMFPEIDDLCQSRQRKMKRSFVSVERELCHLHLQYLIESTGTLKHILEALSKNGCIRGKDFDMVQSALKAVNDALDETCQEMAYKSASHFVMEINRGAGNLVSAATGWFAGFHVNTLLMSGEVFGTRYFSALSAPTAVWQTGMNVAGVWVSPFYIHLLTIGVTVYSGYKLYQRLWVDGDDSSETIRGLLVDALTAVKAAHLASKKHMNSLAKFDEINRD